MRNAAFVIFHTDNLIFMNARWNGTWGFPGGMVEEGETLKEAVIRECEEEIDVDISGSDVEYRCNHLVRKGLTSHAFTCKVNHHEMMNILHQALGGSASHNEEVNGVGVFNVDRQDFYQMKLAPTVIDEIEEVFGDRLKKTPKVSA